MCIIENENHFQFAKEVSVVTYKTKQREDILKAIQEQKGEFLVKDLYIALEERIGLTTIYRMVDKLVLEGILRKSIRMDNVTTYQYLENCEEKNHFYLKCRDCGEVKHVDCDCICQFVNHACLEHDFELDTQNVVFMGLCHSCQRKENQ